MAWDPVWYAQELTRFWAEQARDVAPGPRAQRVAQALNAAQRSCCLAIAWQQSLPSVDALRLIVACEHDRILRCATLLPAHRAIMDAPDDRIERSTIFSSIEAWLSAAGLERAAGLRVQCIGSGAALHAVAPRMPQRLRMLWWGMALRSAIERAQALHDAHWLASAQVQCVQSLLAAH